MINTIFRWQTPLITAVPMLYYHFCRVRVGDLDDGVYCSSSNLSYSGSVLVSANNARSGDILFGTLVWTIVTVFPLVETIKYGPRVRGSSREYDRASILSATHVDAG